MASTLIVSACSIVYELLISALSSYFLGSSVLHFSLTIGFFLFFMGVGSFLSRYVHDDLLDRYVWVEILIGLVGGLSGIALYAAYSVTDYYYLVAIGWIAAIGILCGLEIPLLTRMLESSRGLKQSLSDVLSFDYMGALVASLFFPLILIPYLGLQKTAFAIGLLNTAVAAVLLIEFRPRLRAPGVLTAAVSGVAIALLIGLFNSFRIVGFFEQYLYQDEIVHAEQSVYQRVVLTQRGKDLRLFLNGSLQFSSIDEYRYHEPLVHIPMAHAGRRDHVLVLGGGDGLAVREILRYDDVESVTLVDLDPAVIALGAEHAMLRALNDNALVDPRVTVVTTDAFKYVEQSDQIFNVVIIDLPDPSLLDLGKLYSVEFYRLLKNRVAGDGVVVTQASSPYFARKVFWCVNTTLAEVFDQTIPFQSYVPSFGLWGFVMAGNRPAPRRSELPEGLRYLTSIDRLLEFAGDVGPIPVEPNRLENQIIVRYYESSWEL